MKYAIQYNDGGYYKGMSGIGPMFGGSIDEAMPFETCMDATMECTSHFAFTCADVVELPENAVG
jgi:hypothetical protein